MSLPDAPRSTSDQVARDDLVPVALEEALAVDIDLRRTARSKSVAVDVWVESAWISMRVSVRRDRPRAPASGRSTLATSSARAGSSSQAVIRRVSAAYSRRPSGTIASPPSWTWTVVEPAEDVLVDAPRRRVGDRRRRRHRARRDPARRGPAASVRKAGTGASPGPPAGGMTGSSRRDGVASPRWTRNVAGRRRRPEDRPQLRRERDPEAMARRPAVAGGPQRHADSRRPRPARAASGAACERRWVRLSTPALTSATDPSGATSDSRTAQRRDRRIDLEVDDDLGHAEDVRAASSSGADV